MPAQIDEVLKMLLDRCRRDQQAWINGDGSGYALPADGTIMGAVGGYSYGGDATTARQLTVAKQWTSGTGSIEFLNGAVVGDFAWLAMVERSVVVLESGPGEQRWDLRVTEVFRLGPSGWERVHRQADPLVEQRSVAAVSRLLT
jgi:hypothetical protein